MQCDLEELRRGFGSAGFIIDEEDLNVVFLALRLEKALLVSGPPGVGKTDLARVLAKILGARLIRLQCHEGLDESNALYDWNFQRQLVQIHLASRSPVHEDDMFGMPNILQRPLLQAITATDPVVLLIDEVDRSDPDFEAFLLEVLSDYQVSVPEIGTIRAGRKPVVVITSNEERELSEALRRRCIFLYLDFPGIEQDAAIIKQKCPEILNALQEEIAIAVARSRDAGSHPVPGAELGLDWAQALLMLDADRYQHEYVDKTLEALARNRENLLSIKEFLQGNSKVAAEKQEKEAE